LHRASLENYGRPRNIQGASRRKALKTTIRDKEARPAPDLVNRQFTASTTDQLWVADITYVPTLTGFLFLAIILDVFSCRVVGWAMATHMRAELVVDALDMAIHNRKPKNVIHHSEQRSQPASEPQWVRLAIATITRCARASTPFSSASCSSHIASRPSAQRRSRFRHTSLRNLSPMEFERRNQAA